MSDCDPAPASSHYKLRLFVAGTSQRSLRTVANLRRICDLYLVGAVDLEIVDIYQQPALAEHDQVVAAPTLVKIAPLPLRRIIGDLSDEPAVLRALELVATKRTDDAS